MSAPTVFAPGQGPSTGGPLALVCRNETGGALTRGQGGVFDIGRSQSSVVRLSGGELGEASLNTIVADTLTPSPAPVSGYAPAALYQEHASLADGSDGRFMVQGRGVGSWASAQTLPYVGGFMGFDRDLREPADLNAITINFQGKIIAIGEAATVSGVGECFIDGWVGFGMGWRG